MKASVQIRQVRAVRNTELSISYIHDAFIGLRFRIGKKNDFGGGRATAFPNRHRHYPPP